MVGGSVDFVEALVRKQERKRKGMQRERRVLRSAMRERERRESEVVFEESVKKKEREVFFTGKADTVLTMSGRRNKVSQVCSTLLIQGL